MKRIDLHVHSTKSDGSKTPSELVNLATQKNLAAFALTDHDTVDGIEEAIQSATSTDLEVIPGIELSTEYFGRDVHILGLYIDHTDSAFLSHLKLFQDSRHLRNEKICNNLRKEGVEITYEMLQELYPNSVITRAHYGRFLLAYGYVKSMKEAFDRYVGDHCKAYVPREKISPEQAVDLITNAHGVPILAHPTLYHLSTSNLETLISSLKQAGLQGIEAVYSTYALADERQMKKFASTYQLLISGGSDYHGEAKPGLELGTGYGKLFVPDDLLIPIKEAAKKGKI